MTTEMGAINPGRRQISASAAAERFRKHPRTIRKVMAEPRRDYERRAHARQQWALALRGQGLSYTEIGKELGIGKSAAAGLVRRARARKSVSE